MNAALDADASAVMSLVAYHGRASACRLVSAHGGHWVRTLRTAAVWLLRTHARLRRADIAALFAGMHTTNVDVRMRAARALRARDPDFSALVDRVLADLQAEPV